MANIDTEIFSELYLAARGRGCVTVRARDGRHRK